MNIKINRHESSSASAQRMRLLARLRKGPCNTIEARHELDILGVAPRIYELRHILGYDIMTSWTTEPNPGGGEHRIAKYILMSEKTKGGADES